MKAELATYLQTVQNFAEILTTEFTAESSSERDCKYLPVCGMLFRLMVCYYCLILIVLISVMNDWCPDECQWMCMTVEGLPVAAEQDLSPVWVPDDGATVCMHCRKTQFTVINRRVCHSVVVIIVGRDTVHRHKPTGSSLCHCHHRGTRHSSPSSTDGFVTGFVTLSLSSLWGETQFTVINRRVCHSVIVISVGQLLHTQHRSIPPVVK